MDSFAIGLEIAHKLLKSGELEDFIEKRYSSYISGIGKKIQEENINISELENYIIDIEVNKFNVESGEQERLESIINRYLLTSLN